MRYIKFFNEIAPSDVSEFGGKVTALGVMLRHSFPIPNGFGVSIWAHKEFKGKPFSAEFKAELHNAFSQLRAQRVAVRSSAIAEDSKDASWAGQLESYLNIEEDRLEEAVRKCWRSIEAEHAQEYAKDKDVKGDDLLVGVVVQAMIDSEVAGVMFTVNPVTSDKRRMIIDGAFGLGESVVQGIVTPDSFLVDKRSDRVVKFDVNIKEKMVVYDKGATRTIAVPEEKSDRAVLREQQVVELARIGKKIEKYYRTPQDIEWAYASDKFYILQVRPITTL